MASYKLIIPGTLPGLNEYIAAERSSRYKAAAMKRDAQDLVSWQLLRQLPSVDIAGAVIIRYLWVEPNRRRDPSNVSAYGRKIIEDSLVASGVITNDNWAYITGFTDDFTVDKDNPRVEVVIEEVET